MKQAKKMLCMLLVMLLAFSSVSIGVSAAYTSYATPASYDVHESPVLSTTQRGSQLLDFVDAMLYDMRDDLYIDITVMKLDFTSVDKALDTVAGLKGAAGLVGGDVNKLDFDAVPSTRRGTAGKTDLNILYELLYFLDANKAIVGRFLNGNLDLGIIKSFVDLDFNVHNLLIDMLYELMIDENYDVDVAPVDYNTWTADKILQQFVDTMLLGGTGADGQPVEGFLPSMAGKTNINTQTIWGIIENAANAATKDLLIPFIKNDLSALLDEAKAANPHPAWDYLNVSNLNLDNYVWGQYDKTNGIIAELNHFLYVVLNQVWTGDKFWVDGGNDKLEQNLDNALEIVYKELGTLILPATAEFVEQSEFEDMDLQAKVVYVAKQFIRSEMPYVLWEDTYGDPLPLENLGQLACYIIYSIGADFLPVNYMEEVEYGYAEWGTDFALYMLADIATYYLNGALPVEIQYGSGVEQFLNVLVNWALQDNNFGGFFKGCGVSDSDSPWTKIDKTVFTVLPLHKILGGGATGSYDLLMNKILLPLLELDLDTFLSILYKADYSLLNMTIPKFVVEIVDGVLNVIVARNTQPAIISKSLTSIDAIIQNSNLAGTAERLLNGLYNAGRYQYFWDSLLPILNPLLIDESEYSYNIVAAPSGYKVNSYDTLAAAIDEWNVLMDEPDDIYNMNGADWCESTDFVLWRYDKFDAAVDDAGDVLGNYDGAVQWVADANERLAAANASGNADEITAAQEDLAAAQAEVASFTAKKYADAAYKIEYYYNKMTANQNEAVQSHLMNVIYLADAKSFDEGDYDPAVWAVYEEAYDHAYTIYDTLPYDEDTYLPSPDLKQSMVNAARKNLLDAMLKLEVKLASIAELVAYYEEVKNTVTDGYSEETVARFVAALEEAKYWIDGEIWTADEQINIDDALAELKAAFEGLSEFVEAIKPALDKIKEEVKTAEANGVNLMWNLATNLTPDALLDNFVNSDENGTLEVKEKVKGVVGTGTKLLLKDADGKVVEEYEVVIFGDANGDGVVDVMDTICLDLYTVYDASANYAKESAQWYALNLNADADVNANDAVLLDAYTNFEGTIDQGSIY